MGFSSQEYWSGLPLPPPIDHGLSELFTMTDPSWAALHGMPHSFELYKPLCHNKAVIHEADYKAIFIKSTENQKNKFEKRRNV